MMKKLPAFCFGLMAACGLLLLGRQPSRGQGTMNYPTFGRVVRDDARLDALIPHDARIEVLASGFEWTEGPVWMKDGGFLLFSDIPRNSIMKWKEGEGISLFMKPSGFTGVTSSAPSRNACATGRQPSGWAPLTR